MYKIQESTIRTPNHNSSISLTQFVPNFKDLNFGIILVSLSIFLDMGGIQHVFNNIVVPLKIPFLVSTGSIIYALYLVLSRKARLDSVTFKALLLIIAFYIFYSRISTEDPISKEALWKAMLQYLADFIILTTCVTRNSQFVLLIDIFLLAVLHVSIRGVLSHGQIWGDKFLGDENEMSVLVVCALPFAFNLFLIYKSIFKRIFYCTCLFFFVSDIFVASSRGGLLALCVVGLLSWLLVRKKGVALLAVILAIVLVVNFAPKNIFTRLDTLKAQGTEEDTAFDRIYGWHLAMQMFQAHPVLGVGPSNYSFNYPAYSYQYSQIAKRVPRRSFSEKRVAHSTPLEWLATTGIIGSGILLFLLFTLFINWLFIATSRNKIEKPFTQTPDFIVLESIGHSTGVAFVGFWVGACFITINLHPFFWILIPISVISKNFLNEFISGNNFQEIEIQEKDSQDI
jgi:O-antigen ligase